MCRNKKNMLYGYLLILFGVSSPQLLSAQTSSPSPSLDGPTLMLSAIVDGERIPWVLIPEVHITVKQTFSSKEAEAKYRRLRYNVVKVLPYNKKQQKKLVKDCEKEIKDMFNREVKNLTVTQGKILIKLIDRQTGQSSYEVVRELRGGVTAFFYQSIAKVFGHNLKNHYDPIEDIEIESVLRSLGYDANYRAY
jgi:hypothetical protein